MNQTQSRLDREPTFSELKAALEGGLTNAAAAKEFNISEAAIRRFRQRHGIKVPGQTGAYTRVEGDKAEAQTAQTTDPILDDPDTMLRQRGLNPLEWTITHVTANEYQGPNSADAVKAGAPTKVTYYQTKFTCQKIKPEVQLVAARSDGWVSPRAKRGVSIADRRYFVGGPRKEDGAQLAVIVGDQQAPFHDENLHRLFLEWLAENQPNRGVSLGDTADYPDISRHRLDPENTAVVNECTQSTYDILRGYVYASPDTEWQILPGNHCQERLRNILLDKPRTQPLYAIARAATPEREAEEVLTIKHLWRLDELGIEYIDPHGAYDLAEIRLSDKLAVRHGWIARQGSGVTALETLKHLGYSIIVGHGHRQSMVYKTVHDIDKSTKTLVGVEAGCMCRIEQKIGPDGRLYPNYTVAPDWQQGFATVTLWPDGKFKVDLATYVNNVLLYQGKRYE